jgi:ABC-type lipoprotein release transport system permease subunit
MNFLFKISFRNLFRQRRRSILLGSAITFGTAILVLANAFSHGISEVLFNEVVTYVAGHVSLSFTKGGNPYNQVFHDGERIRGIIRERLPDVKRTDQAIGILSRAIGNGKSDNVILVGIDPGSEAIDKKEQKKFEKNFRMIEGSFEALSDSAVENPVALAVDKAKTLNVKLHDIVRVRFTDLHGQDQAARLTVTTIFKPSNVFMSAPIFLNIDVLKKLIGYGKNDIPQLLLMIDNPRKNAKRFADSLHAGLQPPLAVIDGTMRCKKGSGEFTLCALRTDSASLALVNSSLKIVSRLPGDTALTRKSAVISETVADSYGLRPGDTCRFFFEGKFDNGHDSARCIITAIAQSGQGIDGNVVFVNETDFYKSFYNTWPKSTVRDKGPFRPDSSLSIYKALGGEWLLLNRSKTTKESMKTYREVAQKGWKAIVVDVGSMYETASMVLNLEVALNLITFVCVLLLFFIILIGVINTLRMTIRERTREIGTIRAIGMQRIDVRNSFLIETGLLALIASIAGTVLAFAAMAGLSQIKFKIEDNPLSMILDDGHLFFAPTPGAVLFFVVLIVAIAVVTAYFPAKKAAKLSAAEALRHFE